MKVCLDIQPALAQRAGVGRYVNELAPRLAALAGSDSLVCSCFDFRRRGRGEALPDATRRTVRWCPGRVAQFAWKTLGWPSYDFFAGAADVYHFPNFILPPLGRGRSVVTIHDMSFMRYPEFTESRNLRYLARRIRDTAARADAFIADSEFSAGEVRECLGVEAGRVFPIYPGIGGEFKAGKRGPAERALEGLGVRGPYILTVGTLEPRKNIEFVVGLFEKMDGFRGRLVIAGMPGWKYGPILERIERSPRRADIRRLGYVDDRSLRALYSRAEACVFASRYEGFGFPPLEAMSCGTPVVSSSGGSLREVLGDGATLMESFDVDEWKSALEKLMTDTERRRRAIESGLMRAARYTWEDTARNTWAVYRRLG